MPSKSETLPRVLRWMSARLRSQRLLSALVLTLAALAAGCVTEPITGRRILASPLPESSVSEMGAQAYQQLLTEAKVSSSASENTLVERVGRRIAAVTDPKMKAEGREAFQWEFKVIDDPKTVNAFCLPGGKVAFYTAILPICKTEAGVAVVMGHEVGHAYAQHGRQRMTIQVLSQFGLEAVQLALGGSEATELAKLSVGALGLGVQVGGLAFSRDDESAADHIGLMLMAEAGYDPSEAVAFWERMEQLSAGQESPPELLSTHPSHGTRIQRLKELLPQAVAVYEKSKAASPK